MKISFAKLVLTFFFALNLFVTSYAAGASNLWEIYQLALANDPSFQSSALAHEANLLNVPLAKTAFSPTINAGARTGKNYSDITGSSETGDDSNANINLKLPLYDRTSRIEIRQSKLSEQISDLQLQQAHELLILRVANSYFNLLASQDNLEVVRLERISIQRQMDLANKRLEVGLGTRTDLYDAQARFKLAEANEIQAQNLINNNVAQLKEIIGLTPEALKPLSDSAELGLPGPSDIENWVALSQTGNLALQVQSLQKDIALEEIEKQKKARSPIISFDGNYRWADTDADFTNDSYSNTSAAFQLLVPLYLGGSTRLLTEQAGHQYNQTESLLEQARRSASADATSAFLDITSGVSQVEALFDAIRAGESALEAKEEGFNAGLTTNLDVLDAQRDLSQSRTDYLHARYTYILSVLELERAVGDLNEGDVKRINGWLYQ